MTPESTWLTVKEVSALLNRPWRTMRDHVKKGKFVSQLVTANGGLQYRIALSSLPAKVQAKYCLERSGIPVPPEGPDINEIEIETELYSRAPEHQRRTADKYLSVIKLTEGLAGRELRRAISAWNREHPGLATSYPRVIDARRRYREMGIAGLLAGWGKNAGRTTISDDHYEYYQAAYMKEGGPSAKSCWLKTFGFARHNDPEITLDNFPSAPSFQRRLERENTKSAIFLARNGHAQWNRRFAKYIDRDYSNLNPGECIISDHAQVDVAVALPGGKYCFPWITAWRDFKSGKWLGWLHHAEAPNSDHIFQSFYYAVRDHGLPTDVYIDNGKDYRVRDFAGGRKNHKVTLDSGKASSMLGQLNIVPHFALPYNAQTKTIERDFLRNKEWFSKHMPGYRGGNVVERPEILKAELKAGRILSWDQYTTLLDKYIAEVSNMMPQMGKALAGRCPNQVWDTEHPGIKSVSRDALKLFCMRTSREVTIGRNGVRDSELQVTYWAEWMSGMKGEKVYLRRDIMAYQEAWVFTPADELLGTAQLAEQVAALARSEIEKEQLKKLAADKRRDLKITRSYLAGIERPSAEDQLMHLASGVAGINKANGYIPGEVKPRTNRVAMTSMDRVITRNEQLKATGTYDLAAIMPPDRTGKKIVLFESDLE